MDGVVRGERHRVRGGELKRFRAGESVAYAFRNVVAAVGLRLPNRPGDWLLDRRMFIPPGSGAGVNDRNGS